MQMDSIKSHLTYGGASDYNSYCTSVGSYKAYQHIMSELEELEKSFFRELVLIVFFFILTMRHRGNPTQGTVSLKSLQGSKKCTQKQKYQKKPLKTPSTLRLQSINSNA